MTRKPFRITSAGNYKNREGEIVTVVRNKTADKNNPYHWQGITGYRLYYLDTGRTFASNPNYISKDDLVSRVPTKRQKRKVKASTIRAHVHCDKNASKETKRALLALIKAVHKQFSQSTMRRIGGER